MNEYKPDFVSPPGETIEDILKERGWSVSKLSSISSLSTTYIKNLIKGKARINREVADIISLALGSTPEFWLERERQYREHINR